MAKSREISSGAGGRPNAGYSLCDSIFEPNKGMQGHLLPSNPGSQRPDCQQLKAGLFKAGNDTREKRVTDAPLALQIPGRRRSSQIENCSKIFW